MRVLVTGAFGVLGSAVTDGLLEAGFDVTCFDLPTQKHRRKKPPSGKSLQYVFGDITNADQVSGVVAKTDAVIHLAAILPPATDMAPKRARLVNVEGTRNVIRALEQQEGNPLLIYPSSIAVYGPGRRDGLLRQVDDALLPTDPYSKHKVASEALIRKSSLLWVILRLGVSVAPGPRPVSPELLSMMFKNSLTTRLEYIHPDDAALAIIHSLTCPDALGRVLLIGGGESCRIYQRDLFDAFFGAAGIGSLPDEAFGDAPYYTDWMETKESAELLDYQRHSFADFTTECKKKMYPVRILTTPFRLLVRWYLLKHSQAWRVYKKSK